MTNSKPRTHSLLPAEFLLIGVASIALTYVFWGTLWEVGGLVGGDIYSYFFPQKQFYAAELRAGEFPLWNNQAGHGYPILGESQTGVFYPFNLLFYSVCDVNTAYNGIQILHYGLAFLFTWLYARRLNVSGWGAALAALIYTYGWFPARICWEWAIIGGAWLPLALWAVEDYLQTRHWWVPVVLCFALTLQILPGHYNLAFITLLVVTAYAPLRLWLGCPTTEYSGHLGRTRSLVVLAVAIVSAVGITAIQWVPSWELKQLSQRAQVGGEHDPAYGRIPFWYLSQIVVRDWYFDQTLDLNSAGPAGAPLTNKVEAHLYFGILSLGLLAWSLWARLFLRDRRLLVWLLLGTAALAYATGAFLPVTKFIPGFNFFRGPGRFGIISTFAVALLAGAGLNDLCARMRPRIAAGCACLLLAAITYDLLVVGQAVATSLAIPEPPLKWLPESPVRRILSKATSPVRLFSRGANLPTLLGVASTPLYLGIGPAEYYDPELQMPGILPFDDPATPEQVEWLRQAGVTHVLSFIPLDLRSWPVRPLWQGIDPFLNRAWARREPIYLYELLGGRGRISWSKSLPGNQALVRSARANRVEIEATSAAGGELILTDLQYPGWDVAIDDQPAKAKTVDGMYRGVDVPAGEHRVVWSYSPRSWSVGAAISCLGLLLLAALAHLLFWYPVQPQTKTQSP